VDLSALANFDGAVITVNNVIWHLPRADYWITVDPATNGVAQRAMVDRRDGCYYFACYPKLDDFNRMFYPIVEGVHYLERIVPDDGVYKLQEQKDKITTTDSVYSALGLAYHFEASEIVLLGVDGYGFGHWYDLESPYNLAGRKDFDKYLGNVKTQYRDSVEQFRARGTRVINASPNSIVDCFEKCTPEFAIKYYL
jgi:hypothetical protein